MKSKVTASKLKSLQNWEAMEINVLCDQQFALSGLRELED